MLITGQRTLGLLAGLTLAGTACDDAAGPNLWLNVLVSVERSGAPTVSVDQDSVPTIQCIVDLRADVKGPGTTVWRDLELVFYAGGEQRDSLGNVEVGAADVALAWGRDSITGGSVVRSSWWIEAPVPFNVNMIFSYGIPPVVKQTTAHVSCTPPVQPGPPPTISDMSVFPTNAVEPGDTLLVSYAASSEMGLWMSGVLLSGPCEVERWFADWPQTSVTRSARLAIPEDCDIGLPVTVAVVAVDALVQSVGGSLVDRFALVDVTPPLVHPMLFPPMGGSASEWLGGDYFVGEELYFIFIASDNHALDEITWEVAPAGYVASREATGREVAPWIKDPIQATWALGPVQLRFYARDSVGLISDTVVSSPGAVNIYPSVDRPTASLAMGGVVPDFAIDQRRGVMYVLESAQSRITVASLAPMVVTATHAVPAAPASVDLTRGGDSLVMALPGLRALGVIDLNQNPWATSIVPMAGLDTTIDQRPWGVRVAANGKALVSLRGSAEAAYTLHEVDLATGAQRARTDAGSSGYVGAVAMARSADHRAIVLATSRLLQRYEAVTDGFGPPRSITEEGALSVDGTGQYVAMGLDLYDADLQFVRRMHSALGGGGFPTSLSPDGVYLYQAAGIRGLVRGRVADGAIVDRLSLVGPADVLRASPDGTTLVMVSTQYGQLSTITTIYLK